eukprot:12939785-Alexandrium_andersonii.AAC.1
MNQREQCRRIGRGSSFVVVHRAQRGVCASGFGVKGPTLHSVSCGEWRCLVATLFRQSGQPAVGELS